MANEKCNELAVTIHHILDEYRTGEEGLTYAEMVGILELVKGDIAEECRILADTDLTDE